MDFRKYLKTAAKKIYREVEKVLKGELKKAKKTDKKLVPLLQAFAKSCQGGKRIRGSLVVLGYQLGSNVPNESGDSSLIVQNDRIKKQNDIYKVAAAYEILHGGILVHDDIIDKSLIRRDKPSLYQALGGNHYGVSQAISLADYGFFLALKIISESNFPPVYKIEALKFFSKVMTDTAWGQMLDIEKTNPIVVMRLKTARYSISGPLELGAVLAGAGAHLEGESELLPGVHLPGERWLNRLGLFGENLGIAFQIRDDILDFEVSDKIGVDKAKEEADRYKNQALKLLPEITKDKKMSTLLQQLSEWLVSRNK